MSASNGGSIMTCMQKKFWKTKQVLIKATGKKEDEYVVASDADLDAKLEFFRSAQITCTELLKVIKKYQHKISHLSWEENELGLFLRQQAEHNKTKAGRMMEATSKALLSSAKLRLALAAPLRRMHQDVDTFHRRAIADTLLTVTCMEAMRTEYRGSLLWMRDISQELDPDTYKQLEEFRKVQAQVRTNKAQFDRLKNDVCQKVEVLGISRCSLLSHLLNTYQATLLHFWEQTSQAMAAIQEAFRSCEPYQFTVLQDLRDPLEQQADGDSKEESKKSAEQMAAEQLIFLDTSGPGDLVSESASMDRHDGRSRESGSCSTLNSEAHDLFGSRDETSTCDDLLLTSDLPSQDQSDLLPYNLVAGIGPLGSSPSGVSGEVVQEQNDGDRGGLSFLQELLSLRLAGSAEFTCEWQDAAAEPTPALSTPAPTRPPHPSPVHLCGPSGFLPSQLLDHSLNSTGWPTPAVVQAPLIQSTQSAETLPPYQRSSRPTANAPGSLPQDTSAWFDFLAGLDPLSDPDTVGHVNKDLLSA